MFPFLTFSEFDKREPKDGSLAQLLSGYCGETINSMISRLYRKADFDLERASRGIVFLDGMHKIGENQGLSKLEQQQVLREILQIVEGATPIDVTRAGSSSHEREILNTSNMFFICFGVFEAEEQLLNQDFDEEEYENDFEVIPEEPEDGEGEDFKILHQEPNNNTIIHNNNNNNNSNELIDDKDLPGERRDSRTSTISMDTTVSSNSSTSTTSSGRNSNSSSEKSPEPNCKRRNSSGSGSGNGSGNNNQLSPKKLTRRKNEFTCTRKHNSNNNKPLVKSDESDVSSTTSSTDEWDQWYNIDDSFQGLKENKLARLVTEAENSPIPHYQALWGMKDVDLKFTPEALEIIANQAMSQQAGRDGVAIILEKLFLTVKFDILGTDIVAVEITEDFVMGKTSPIYHHASSRKKSCTIATTNRNHHQHHHQHQQQNQHYARNYQNCALDSILEEAASSLSDYDQGMMEQLEI